MRKLIRGCDGFEWGFYDFLELGGLKVFGRF